MVGIDINGSIPEILQILEDAQFGERYIIVYPSTDEFRKIYGQYTKKHLEQDSEVVVLLPFYESIESVMTFLHRHYSIDVAAYGSKGFLMIADAYKTYMGFQEDRDLFFKRLLSHAAMSGKAGISFIMDMGMASLLQKLERQVLSYQNVVPEQQQFKIKAFFSYHQKDYQKLSDTQRTIRFSDNYKSLIITC